MRRSALGFPALFLLGLLSTAPAAALELFRTIPALEFSVEGPSRTIGDFVPTIFPSPGTPGHFARHCDGARCTFLADPGLPHGATVVGIEIDACNSSGSRIMSFALLEVASNETLFGGMAPYRVGVEYGVAPSTGCGFTLAAPTSPIQIDLFSSTYLVAVQVDSPLLCAPTDPCPNSQTRFSAVRVYYEPSPVGTVEPTMPTPHDLFP